MRVEQHITTHNTHNKATPDDSSAEFCCKGCNLCSVNIAPCNARVWCNAPKQAVQHRSTAVSQGVTGSTVQQPSLPPKCVPTVNSNKHRLFTSIRCHQLLEVSLVVPGGLPALLCLEGSQLCCAWRAASPDGLARAPTRKHVHLRLGSHILLQQPEVGPVIHGQWHC